MLCLKLPKYNLVSEVESVLAVILSIAIAAVVGFRFLILKDKEFLESSDSDTEDAEILSIASVIYSKTSASISAKKVHFTAIRYGQPVFVDVLLAA